MANSFKWEFYQKEKPDFICAIKCKRPKMKDHRGRTWDHSEKFIVNNQEMSGFLDTTWGEYIYFTIENQWYKVSLDCVRHNIPVKIPKNRV